MVYTLCLHDHSQRMRGRPKPHANDCLAPCLWPLTKGQAVQMVFISLDCIYLPDVSQLPCTWHEPCHIHGHILGHTLTCYDIIIRRTCVNRSLLIYLRLNLLLRMIIYWRIYSCIYQGSSRCTLFYRGGICPYNGIKFSRSPGCLHQ